MRVDAQTVGRDCSGEPAFFDQIRITTYRAREIPRTLAVDWISVPDPADVNSAAYPLYQFGRAAPTARPHHDIGGAAVRSGIEAAHTIFADAVAVAGWEARSERCRFAQLCRFCLVAGQSVAVIVIGK